MQRKFANSLLRCRPTDEMGCADDWITAQINNAQNFFDEG